MANETPDEVAQRIAAANANANGSDDNNATSHADPATDPVSDDAPGLADDPIVLTRMGHYHFGRTEDLASSPCLAAVIIDTHGVESGYVGLEVWSPGAPSTALPSVKLADPAVGLGTFHLSRACPYGR